MASKEINKGELRNIGLDALKQYLVLDVADLDPKILVHFLQKAKLGLQLEKEIALQSRAAESNQIRIARAFAVDKEELRKIIKRTLPQYTLA